MNRRHFIGAAAAAGLAGLAPAQQYADPQPVPDAIKKLKPMTGGIQPITADERQARIEKARKLMRQRKIGAVVLEGGANMFYYTGTRWPQSDRTFALVLPAIGEPAWIVPEADQERAHAAIQLGTDVRAWPESEGPYRRLAQVLKERGAASGQVGIEERVRFAVFDGLRKEMPGAKFTIGDPVTVACRVSKSPAEIALLQRANDITIAAYQAAFATLHEGMGQRELSANISAAYAALGVQGNVMVVFGKYTAYPHGSIQPQTLHEGDMVLVDDGCSVEGYQSDITRTTVFGKPTARQREIWNLERKAQDAALAAAKPGATCESVDAAARKVITDYGFGPGYKVPGLPHRTGHGIGLEGHEWTYLVKGNKTRLEPGMCFSDEPMIAIYGEFGVRLEDCMYITADGARMFTKQSPAIDQPFG
ncbi:MAG TPA: Xaa-Pro peptidase family protein [Bryobacteraceae bacterium]|jgi:Xaa-Pro dipeptidase|nr:Xaa-Pro peptidase family protein [Bryobacteraceae bacterium]